MDYSPLGSSVHGVFQARVLEWVAMPSSRDRPNSEIEPISLKSSASADVFFPTSSTSEALVDLDSKAFFLPLLSE